LWKRKRVQIYFIDLLKFYCLTHLYLKFLSCSVASCFIGATWTHMPRKTRHFTFAMAIIYFYFRCFARNSLPARTGRLKQQQKQKRAEQNSRIKQNWTGNTTWQVQKATANKQHSDGAAFINQINFVGEPTCAILWHPLLCSHTLFLCRLTRTHTHMRYFCMGEGVSRGESAF